MQYQGVLNGRKIKRSFEDAVVGEEVSNKVKSVENKRKSATEKV